MVLEIDVWTKWVSIAKIEAWCICTLKKYLDEIASWLIWITFGCDEKEFILLLQEPWWWCQPLKDRIFLNYYNGFQVCFILEDHFDHSLLLFLLRGNVHVIDDAIWCLCILGACALLWCILSWLLLMSELLKHTTCNHSFACSLYAKVSPWYVSKDLTHFKDSVVQILLALWERGQQGVVDWSLV